MVAGLLRRVFALSLKLLNRGDAFPEFRGPQFHEALTFEAPFSRAADVVGAGIAVWVKVGIAYAVSFFGREE